MNWLTAATFAPLVLLAYQLCIDWLPLFPWNDRETKSARDRLLETIINYSPLLLISFGFTRASHTGWIICMVGTIVYLIGHLNAWWRPYFLGATEKEQEEYKRLFSRTYKFLPPIGNNPIPDAEHVVLGSITLLMVLSAILAVVTN